MPDNSAREFVTIHQALHGYRDGHRLLESSMSLSGDARSILLTLSDMSGPSMVPGFDFYVTGYPVFEAGCYALAATWYAPEMERPGCVWTHTLLIDFSHLAAVEDLRALQAYFVRPRLGGDFSSYQQPIAAHLDVDGPVARFHNIPSMRLLQALYTQDDAVLCSIENAAQPLDFLLQIWSQQWPKLRRSFKFCTGALSPRRLKAAEFDLQFFPRRN